MWGRCPCSLDPGPHPRLGPGTTGLLPLAWRRGVAGRRGHADLRSRCRRDAAGGPWAQTPRQRSLPGGGSGGAAGQHPLWPSAPCELSWGPGAIVQGPAHPCTLPSLPQLPASGPCWRGGPCQAASRGDGDTGGDTPGLSSGQGECSLGHLGGMGGVGTRRPASSTSIY